MYEDYFGLDRPPFKITPDTSLFFDGGKRGDILAALVYAVHRGEGIIKVVGEVGSGKTMLCRMLQLKLPETVEIVYIANPSVSPEDILFVIAHELSLPVTKEASKHEVMHQLHDYLLQRHMENRQVVLFIEEAQGMPLDTLEEIRLLSNLETDQHKLLQIVLFGQPELDENLSKQSIRQLRERITHTFTLDPLDRDEIYRYLNFRMREVGYTGPELINSAIAKKVEQHSEGLLRRINIIADKILLSAFAEGTHSLSPKHVTQAVNDSEFSHETRGKSRALWWLGLLVLAALAFALYQTQGHRIEAIASKMAPKSQNTAISDNMITDNGSRHDETGVAEELGEAVNVAQPAQIEMQASADTGSDRLNEAGTGNLTTPQASAIEAQSAEQAKRKMQQVKQTVSEIEVAVSKAEAAVRQSVAPTREPVLVAASNSTATQLAAAVPKSTTDSQGAVSITEPPDGRLSGAEIDAAGSNPVAEDDYQIWLAQKLRQSRDWLRRADQNKVSIQVLMRSKSGARELVYYLQNEWPLDISKTYLYEVTTQNRSIYRVFYSEFDTVSEGRNQLELLPESVKVNSPYLHSVYRMQKALL